jgi:RNA polymerase sigma factor (sigma-70 family)
MPIQARAAAEGGDAAADRRRAAWMAAAQEGDQAAYQALLRECIPLVRAVARGQGVPAGSAEDVVQEVLLTLHRVRATYDPRRPFDAWLRAIAQRRAIDWLRSAGRRRAREVFAPEAYDAFPDGDAAPPDRGIESAGAAALLGRAIATLPPGQREAVEHLALQERTLDEAAAATGRSKGALKVNLHRAIKALRQRLNGRA